MGKAVQIFELIADDLANDEEFDRVLWEKAMALEWEAIGSVRDGKLVVSMMPKYTVDGLAADAMLQFSFTRSDLVDDHNDAEALRLFADARKGDA